MHNVLFIEIKKPLINLINKFSDTFFFQSLFPENQFLQVPFRVVVGDDVAVIFAGKHIMTSNDIIVSQTLQDKDLVPQQQLRNLRSHGGIIDYLDGYRKSIILVDSLEYLTEVALAYHIAQVVHIVFDLLHLFIRCTLAVLVNLIAGDLHS